MLGFGFLNAILFTSYNATAQNILKVTDRFPLATAWSAGAVAGLACWIVSAPTELYVSFIAPSNSRVKCRAQLQSTRDPIPSLRIIREIYHSRGIRGLYFGGIITSVRDSIGYGFYFWGYEGAKLMLLDPLDSERARMAKMLAAGGIAGCTTWASVYSLGTTLLSFATLTPRYD